MAASFSSRTAAVLALSGCLLATRAAHAQSAGAAPQPQPYGYAPYAAPPYGYAPPPPAWGAGTAPVLTERNSTGMIAGAITLITVGSVGTIIGAALLAAGTTDRYDFAPCSFDGPCNFFESTTNGGMTAGGATMVAISTAALIVGIPLLAVGMRKVPARPETALVPEVRVGVTGGTLRWQF